MLYQNEKKMYFLTKTTNFTNPQKYEHLHIDGFMFI